MPQGHDVGIATDDGHGEQPDTGDDQAEDMGERTERRVHRTEQPLAHDHLDARVAASLVLPVPHVPSDPRAGRE